ncbi:MAG: two-component system sensor histidine kinase NtrB [Gammaproteobacteria bacterium]
MPESLFQRDESDQFWPLLRLSGIVHIIFAASFLVLTLAGKPQFLGHLDRTLSISIDALYLIFCVVWAFASHLRRPAFEVQVYAQTIIDILVITALMHLSGGVTTGLGMLMIAAVAAVSLMMPGRTALFFAALASLALLLEQLYADFNDTFESTSYAQTGVLGAAVFATALLAMTLARRARQSEALAAKRGFDLANLAQLNEHIVGNIQSGIIVVDDQGRIVIMNDAAWALLGQPVTPAAQALQRLSYPLFSLHKHWLSSQNKESKPQTLSQGSAQDLQARFTQLGTDEQHATLISLEDTAEVRRQMQAGKLASLGRLTASIAHEIRNPLGAISHAAQLLVESPALEAADRRLVTMIQVQSRRLNTTIHNVLRLSRKEDPSPEGVQLLRWLRGFVREFARNQKLPEGWASITIVPFDTTVYIDPNHLHQVLWNLCTNAAKHGMRDGQPWRVRLHGGRSRDSASPYLDVIDNGPGIEQSLQAQIFEPFFTTSPKGTGLGLYISRELCENNGGSLEYIASPAGGSCFRIQFPLTQTEESVVAERAYR